jgi:hypothetical protein
MRETAYLVHASREMNKPIASKRNENHQRKKPIASSDLADPKMKIQWMLTTKAVAAAHAENRRSDRDPRSTTHGDHSTKNSVVTGIGRSRTAKLRRRHSEMPSNPALAPATQAGRNQAAAWRAHATKIRRVGFFIVFSGNES